MDNFWTTINSTLNNAARASELIDQNAVPVVNLVQRIPDVGGQVLIKKMENENGNVKKTMIVLRHLLSYTSIFSIRIWNATIYLMKLFL